MERVRQKLADILKLFALEDAGDDSYLGPQPGDGTLVCTVTQEGFVGRRL